MWHRFENVVPSWWPLDWIVLNEFHWIRVRNVYVQIVRFRWDSQWFGCLCRTTVQFIWIVMIYRSWFNFDWNNAAAISAEAHTPFFWSATVVRNRKTDMIEWIIVARFAVSTRYWASIVLQIENKTNGKIVNLSKSLKQTEFTYTFGMWTEIAAHGKTDAAILLPFFQRITPSDRHIVNDPMMLIVQTHSLFQCVHSFLAVWISCAVCPGAHLFCGHRETNNWTLLVKLALTWNENGRN